GLSCGSRERKYLIEVSIVKHTVSRVRSPDFPESCHAAALQVSDRAVVPVAGCEGTTIAVGSNRARNHGHRALRVDVREGDRVAGPLCVVSLRKRRVAE